jgi:hypothetical protein
MRWAGDDESIERNPASAGAAIVRGPLGFSRPQRAVLFLGRVKQQEGVQIIEQRFCRFPP